MELGSRTIVITFHRVTGHQDASPGTESFLRHGYLFPKLGQFGHLYYFKSTVYQKDMVNLRVP